MFNCSKFHLQKFLNVLYLNLTKLMPSRRRRQKTKIDDYDLGEIILLTNYGVCIEKH